MFYHLMMDCFDSFPTLQICLKKNNNIELYTYHEILFWSINGTSQRLFKKKSGRFGHAELEVFRRHEEGEVEQTGGYAT